MAEFISGESHRPGRIEVVCGSMFSGKTEELIRRLRRAQFAKQRVEIFKPAIDVRYSEEDVVSHDQKHIQSTPIDSSASILLLTSNIDVVGIDEAQFFDDGLVEVCNELANRGVRVIIAGLDMDFKGIPFMATYHPSALLREESLKRPAWEDLKVFKSKLLELCPDYDK